MPHYFGDYAAYYESGKAQKYPPCGLREAMRVTGKGHMSVCGGFFVGTGETHTPAECLICESRKE